MTNPPTTRPRHPDAPDETRYELRVFTKKDFNAWLKKINNAELVAFDTETTSLDYMDAVVVGVSFAVAEGEACYVPVAHTYPVRAGSARSYLGTGPAAVVARRRQQGQGGPQP